jgi:hypothetical protein
MADGESWQEILPDETFQLTTNRFKKKATGTRTEWGARHAPSIFLDDAFELDATAVSNQGKSLT